MDSFNQRKKDVLDKDDKSSIGEWDEKIVGLCERINKSEDYYTTSSCSGRIILMLDEDLKGEGLFVSVSHEKVDLDWLKNNLKEVDGKIKFKTEPGIIHIACKDLESAKKLAEKAKNSGWKRIGLISFDKRIVLEIAGTEKLEFPIFEDGKILVDEYFLKKIIEKSNKKLEKSWEGIEKLESSVK